MSGKAAALGGRLMGPVSEQMLKQFVANFSARLDAVKVQRASEPDTQPKNGDDPATATAGAALAPPPPPKNAELNGFAFAWAVFRDWLRGLFSRKTA